MEKTKSGKGIMEQMEKSNTHIYNGIDMKTFTTLLDKMDKSEVNLEEAFQRRQNYGLMFGTKNKTLHVPRSKDWLED